MHTTLRSLVVTLCGVFTSVVTAVATAYLSRALGTDLFSWSIWVVIPVGAIGIGFAAASGYYFASLWLHQRPTWLLLLQMVVVAGFTQLLIYYLGYVTLDLGNGQHAPDVVSFQRYLDLTLTTEHLRVGRAMVDTGEVGSFGYWLAVIQFVGFLLGGLILWAILRGRPSCRECDTYLRKLTSRTKTFADSNTASNYYDQVFRHPVDSPEFSAFIRVPAVVPKPGHGAVKIKTALYGC
ncbi:MAG TPA: hypothetical protein VFG49_07770, partial [Dyella sp.]|uniref:hypothetical protein n=1 Tax=Dyella sp. TaxID=1869338 RepID=UPI002D765BA5